MKHLSTVRPRSAAAVAAAITLLLTACGQSAPTSYPIITAGAEVMLFRHASDHLVTFDTSSNAISFETDEPQTFQYEFPTREALVTSGDSLNNGFAILDLTGSKVTVRATVDPHQGVFPLASNGTDFYFIVADYGDQGEMLRQRVAQLVGDELRYFTNIGGLITAGVVIDDSLIYNTFVPEQNSYNILTIDRSDLEAHPNVVAEGLVEGDLYAYRGALILEDVHPQLGLTLDCDYYCYFDDHLGLGVSLHPNENQELSLDVIDMETGDISSTTSGDIVDFAINGQTLTVYKIGQSATVMLDGDQ